MINVKNGSLYQWDINRKVEIDDPENQISEVHFCCEGDDEVVIVPFSRNGDKLEVPIPNIFLQSTKKIYVFTVSDDNNEVRTSAYKFLYIFPRQKPSDYIYEETEIFKYKNLEKEIMAALITKAGLDETGKLNAEQLPDNVLKNEALTSAINTALAQAKESGGFKGDPGEKGADGYTPIKGVDYFDGADGKDGQDGAKGDKGDKGNPGAKGADGYTPVKGVDYFTSSEIKEIKDEFASEIITQNTGDSTDKVMSQSAVTKALETLVTLPYGGSKEWLESNGDTSKLYQIGGYVWGYVESDGWTKSDTQFLVVSDEGQMTNVGGTPYLLRNGSEGTVYAYTEASGDLGVPVYDSLPETANEGDIVAVGGRKYKATINETQVPDWKTNYAEPTDQYWLQNTRLNSSNTTACTGMTTTNYIDTASTGDIVRVANLDMDTAVSGQSPAVSTYVTIGTANNRAVTRSSPQFVSEVDGVYTFKGVEGYLRFCGVPTNGDENVIITINEEISYKTETSVTWTDIGDYTSPVEAGWSATDEAYAVIDSLSATANSGTSAIYSGDGYVYSYIGGSDWMQMSKYNAPTLSIDGELSDSSANAVQNKTVAQTINELNSKTSTNANEITAINERIANIETGSDSVTIPSFWQSAVDEAITKIKALQVGKNCITFPFFSDNHQRNGYAGVLIAHIMKECGIPYAFFGGDTISSGYLTESEMIAQDKAFDTVMSYIPEGRFCRAVGNHDGYWNDNGRKEYYTREQIYELFLRGEGIAQNKHFGDDGTYYYIDDIASKVRFIVFNTNSGVISAGSESIDSTQLSWLQNTALSFDDNEWGVVIISHCPISNHYHANVTNAAEVISALNNSGADIIGWYSGHIHRDRMYTHLTTNGTDGVEGTDGTPLGFTEVTITSDHTGIAYEDATKHPVANDDQSHAIDFVTVNKGTRTVNITRLGIGEDRSYTY